MHTGFIYVCYDVTFLYLMYVYTFTLYTLMPVSYTHLDVYKRQVKVLCIKYSGLKLGARSSHGWCVHVRYC